MSDPSVEATDGGAAFGTWPDPTSRFMYHDVMPVLLAGTDTTGRVLDLGGGNGLLREWFPNLTTVDSDPTKGPDVVADITTYTPDTTYDLVVLRYVLHYLDDDQLRQFMHHLAGWHHGPLLVIQFVNDDLEAKYANSTNEVKWFRNLDQLVGLLHPWVPTQWRGGDYYVTPEFYRNRLGHPDPTGHHETVVALTCNTTPTEE